MHHRRDILRTCLRGGGLLALGSIASTLGWRTSHGTCLQRDTCAGCPRFTGCDLPQAVAAKHPAPADSNKNSRSSHA